MWEVFERRLGWSQSRLAREMDVTPSAVSTWLSGITNPSRQTINHLRRILRAEVPEELRKLDSRTVEYHEPAPAAMELREESTFEKLRSLPPDQQKVVESLIDNLHGISSSVAFAAAKSQSAAAAAAHASGRESPPSPSTGGPSGRKRKPKRGTDGPSEEPPAPQGPAQG